MADHILVCEIQQLRALFDQFKQMFIAKLATFPDFQAMQKAIGWAVQDMWIARQNFENSRRLEASSNETVMCFLEGPWSEFRKNGVLFDCFGE